jgi:hypothetical protein
MRNLREIIFMFVMVVGLSLSVSAQKDDQKRPPKDPAPKVNPGEKPPRGNPPPKDPKKPGMEMYLAAAKREDNLG